MSDVLFDFNKYTLKPEAREKLARGRPSTLGAAARIPGVAPADVAILEVFLHRAAAARAASARVAVATSAAR